MSRWPWLLIVVGGLALFIALRDWNRVDGSPSERFATAGEPDLFMQDATITQFDDDGAVRYKLVSAEVRHYEDEGLTRLVAPNLTLNRAPQPPWFARANHGFVRDTDTPSGKTAEVILLREDVHLEQRNPNRFEITAPTLRIYPNRQFAETDQPVIIDTAAGRSSAVGLSGDLNTGLLTLSSSATHRVHTIVLPAQFKRATAKSSQ
jgi:lipopolysaccharide export system protein LptC